MARRILFLLTMLVAAVLVITTKTPSVIAQQKDCPGAPPSRLIIGGNGHVTNTPDGETPLPVRIRQAAGRTAAILGQIKDGAEFQVVEGPVCKDNYAWWHITTEGIEGWIAEGDTNNYYVEPLGGSTGGSTGGTGGSDAATPTPQDAGPTATPIPVAEGETRGRFALYKVGDVVASASLTPYQIAPDLNNVVISGALTQDQLNYVQRNGFVVSPGNEFEFYTVYEKARYNYQPLFITTDSLLHSFHLVFDKVLRTAESQYFIPLLRELNKSTLAQADKTYQSLKGTDWEEAARRTVAYIGVSSRLLDSQAKIPPYVNDLVSQDIASVNNAAGISQSAIFPELENGEDWTQYIPRGHYTKSDTLKAYFRAMMWYGRMTFRLSKPEETKSALLLATAIRDSNVVGKRGIDVWGDLYEPTVFFIGKSDSLTVPQYLDVINKVYGDGAPPQTIQSKGVEGFIAAAKSLPAPKILNAVIQDTQDVTEETKGLRFMGQRFVWDAYVFRNLVYRNVGTQQNPRALPMALDVFAVLGSDRALKILEKEGATTYEKYTSQMDKLRGEVGSLPEADWSETLYGTWLYTLQSMGQPIPQGYPTFMTNEAYTDRLLYAALGSFAELKHDTILYAEQSYAEMGGGGGKSPPPEPVVPPNYVEPVPLFWARLAALAEMTRRGLGSRSLLNPGDAQTLQRVADLARLFQTLSVKELKNEPLTEEENDMLRFYGGDLEKILAATDDKYDPNQGTGFFAENQPQAAVIADVATDPNSKRVLEIGVGRVYDIFAAVPVEGKLWLAHGAVFSYYEFPQPLNNRLTDEQWQKMLSQGKAPDVPDWTFSFMSKSTTDAALVSAVRNFQDYQTRVLWDDPVGSYQQILPESAKNKVSKYMAGQLEPLAKARQYEGRQIIETNFRSFDLQDSATAIVTTRETWRGELHNYGPDEFTDGPKIADRGPYTVDVTYTLTKDKSSGDWAVSNVVVNGVLPPWRKTS